MTRPHPQTTLRRATPNDAADLATLGAATFTQTFGHLYPPEDLEFFLQRTHTRAAWEPVLGDPSSATWLAFVDSAKPIGFARAGKCKLPVENCEPAAGELQQLYVLAQYHNLRIGTKLMELALEWLDAQGHAPLYIGVWSENFGAQRFYARYGFSKVGEYGFPVGQTIDQEFILKRTAAP